MAIKVHPCSKAIKVFNPFTSGKSLIRKLGTFNQQIIYFSVVLYYFCLDKQKVKYHQLE